MSEKILEGEGEGVVIFQISKTQGSKRKNFFLNFTLMFCKIRKKTFAILNFGLSKPIKKEEVSGRLTFSSNAENGRFLKRQKKTKGVTEKQIFFSNIF